jgi:MFS family permease
MAREESAGDITQGVDQRTAGTANQARVRSRRGGLKTFSSLKNNRDYRYLFTGNLFANGAQWLQLVTIGWLALDVSGSVFHSIMAVAVRALPTLLLGPWGGVLADRWDRRKLAMATQAGLTVSAFIFAVLVARGQVSSVWYIYAYTLVGGVAFTIMQPVRQALIANTVRPANMGNALALNAMTVTTMRLIGAAAGGVLIETVDFQWNFFVEASLYIGMALLLIPMRTPYQAASAARHASPINNLVEGLSYILKSRVILRLMLLNFTRTAVFMPLLLLLPGYTSEALNAGAGIGTAMIVSMGIGGVVASLAISSWGFFTRKGLVCLITLISGSSVILSLGLAHWVWYAVPIMMVMGLSQTHFIVSNQTLVQTIVPDTLRGRVSSVWHYEQGLIPLFAGVIGVMAEGIGIASAMAWVGGVALALGLFFLLRFKEIRALD